MAYKVTLRDVAIKDFDVLDGNVQRQAIKQLNKLKQSPGLGNRLRSQNGRGPQRLSRAPLLQEPIPNCVESSVPHG